MITQEQADEFRAWLDARPDFLTDEFKEWLESKPALPTDEFKEWLESRPDIPGLFQERHQARIGPSEGMKRGFGRFGGMLRGRCSPEAPAQ